MTTGFNRRWVWLRSVLARLVLLVSAVLVCVSFSGIAHAAGLDVLGFGQETPYDYAAQLAEKLKSFGHLAAGFVGVAAFAVFIAAAYMFITGGGNEGRVEKAKKAMFFALVGIGVALMAELAVQFMVGVLAPGSGQASLPPYPQEQPQKFGQPLPAWQDVMRNEFATILGSMFGKIAAIPIQLLAWLLFTLIGAKYPYVLIYNQQDDPRHKLYYAGPFSDSEWVLIGKWYVIFSGLVGAFIMLAIVISAYRLLVTVKDNPGEYAEAKMSILYCIASLFMVMCAPLMFKVAGDINNGIVEFLYRLVTSVPAVGKVPDLISPQDIISWNQTLVNNPIGYAFVVLAAAGLTLTINVIYIVRHFVLLVFLVMTPVFAATYAVSRSKKVFNLWIGEILTNLFMQTVHAFVWTLFIVFHKFWAGPPVAPPFPPNAPPFP
ncbi:pilin [Thermanaeromonas toyohensis]|uniref:pilin n=1 Tax=Thermanaeromonas toyohensis TaxID=161154 RepID=UPI0012F4796A|nr:pilin [Thermanaeromonas toyohensis]